MSGSGKGRPRKPIKTEAPVPAEPELDVSHATLQDESESKKTKGNKPKPQDPAAFLRKVDIARSRIAMIIDTLADNDDEVALKRNVPVSVKHLKLVYEMLEQP
jgi:hypothetical protein